MMNWKRFSALTHRSNWSFVRKSLSLAEGQDSHAIELCPVHTTMEEQEEKYLTMHKFILIHNSFLMQCELCYTASQVHISVCIK